MFIIAALSATIAGAAGFGLAWRLQSATILEMESNAKDTRIAAAAVARKTIERTTNTLIVAQNNATTRAIKLRADVASSATVGNGLRDTTASTVRTATSDPTVCSDTAATLGELLTTVSKERRELAETADRHVIDIQALVERHAP